MEAAARRPAWRRVIRSVEVATPGSWFSTIFYCAFAFPMFAFMLGTKDLFPILIAGFFAAWGVAGLLVMIWHTLEQRKFGDIHITLAGDPPVLGGNLTARLELPHAAAKAHHVRVELQCIESREDTDSDGKPCTREVRHWYREIAVVVRREGIRRVAAFRLPIPDEPTVKRGRDYNWELKIRADLPGIDLGRTFPIDVAQPPPGTPVRPPQDWTAAPVGVPSKRQAELEAAEVEAPPRSAAARWALIAANLIPVAGVLLWGWDVGHIVLVYWAETVIIGAINVLRIAAAEPERIISGERQGSGIKARELPIVKAALVGFFVTHFGGFCIAEAQALAFLFHVDLWRGLQNPALAIAALALLASHLISFRVNYLNGGEYRRVNMAILMTRPYGRIFVLHLVLFLGGAAVQLLKAPALAMAIFVGLKIAIDYHMHQQERRILSETRTVR